MHRGAAEDGSERHANPGREFDFANHGLVLYGTSASGAV